MDAIDLLTPITTVSHNALRHEVMRRLMRTIFEGKLPAGTRLMVLKLAKRLGTSSTPVREALVELDAVGVVEFVHNRGAVVAPFGPEQLRQIYQVRRILETEATRCACGRIQPAQLASLEQDTRDLLETRDQSDWLSKALNIDLRMHELIADRCGNERLMREMRRYDRLAETIREIIGNDRAAQDQAIGEHLTILDALKRGDAEGAASAMARHIESAASLAEKVMFSPK